jgi:hypothetical protein
VVFTKKKILPVLLAIAMLFAGIVALPPLKAWAAASSLDIRDGSIVLVFDYKKTDALLMAAQSWVF